MSSIISILAINLTIIMALMCLVWLVSLLAKDAGVADVFWGLGFTILSWNTFIISNGYPLRRLLLAILITLWGLRLAIHIWFRNRGIEEDPRYRAWRMQHGKHFWWISLFKVFFLQGFFLWIISLTVQIGQASPSPPKITFFDYAGIFLWVAGFFFESVSDWQLTAFKSRPQNKGRVMDKGLWALSRHPNYFGETLVWWGLFMISISAWRNIWTIISPLLITYLLLKVSGVPLLERGLKKRNPEYEAYINKTSAFIPLPPKQQ